jgi:hypothetical protein
MAASPFATTSAAPLILIIGTTRKSLKGCVIETGDNKAKAEEWGIAHVFTIEAHIPKALVTSQPRVDLDAVEYQGRQYKLNASSGDEAFSPVWVVGGECPVT